MPTPADTAETWLTTAQVANRLQITVETCRALIADGTIPAVQLGRQYRIRPADLDAAASAHLTTRGSGS